MKYGPITNSHIADACVTEGEETSRPKVIPDLILDLIPDPTPDPTPI